MRLTLPIIVVSQFLCTSVWFAGNSVLTDVAQELQVDPSFLAHLTSAIQFGFISGTLVFAIFTISDRFSPSRVFFLSSIAAAIFNFGMTIDQIGSFELLALRFSTGFFLAGIYPVGMKIASDYYRAGLGKSLGFLVGALVLGTAFPHLLKYATLGLPWKYVIYATSILSLMGGAFIFLFVPDGPYRKFGQKLRLTTFIKGFRDQNFRAISFGYFGHMWELYAFWAFLPVILTSYNALHPEAQLNIPLLSFLIIASGSLSSALGGIIAQRFGAKRIATISLLLSCICCLISPFLLNTASTPLVLMFLFSWGIFVIADSPLFSTLVAQHAPEESRGTSLTIVNCLGFATTIISIQFILFLSDFIRWQYLYLFLAIGPVIGLYSLVSQKRNSVD